MKTLPLCLLVAVIACGTGLGAGWALRGAPAAPAPPPAVKNAKPLVPARHGAAPSPVAEESHRHAAGIVTAELEMMKSMSLSEFSMRMADAWLDYGNPDNHIRRGLYLSACDGEKAVAFYREFKKRKGMSLKEDSGLREFFTIIAKRDGPAFMKQVLELSPEGVPELDSLTHGWAAANPDEAVAWLNALPDGTPYYKEALAGMMWGIAERSPSMAMKIYGQLDPEDRSTKTVYNIANSTVMKHGMKGLQELVSAISDDEDKPKFIMASMDYAMREPPSDFVTWMAAPLESAPYLTDTYTRMASRWAAGAPDEAMAWLAQNGSKPGGSNALSIMAASLARSGKMSEVEEWLTANPNAPGKAAIEAGAAQVVHP